LRRCLRRIRSTCASPCPGTCRAADADQIAGDGNRSGNQHLARWLNGKRRVSDDQNIRYGRDDGNSNLDLAHDRPRAKRGRRKRRRRRRRRQRAFCRQRQRRWLAQRGIGGRGTSGVSGVPSGPANAGGLNNSGNDPSGAGNASRLAAPPPPGINSAGTANSSGPGAGVTTGSARSKTNEDAAIDAEDKAIDRKLKGICRGC